MAGIIVKRRFKRETEEALRRIVGQGATPVGNIERFNNEIEEKYSILVGIKDRMLEAVEKRVLPKGAAGYIEVAGNILSELRGMLDSKKRLSDLERAADANARLQTAAAILMQEVAG